MSKQCSDFDFDCYLVKDPFSCWMGHAEMKAPDGNLYVLPVADGYCPLCKNTEDTNNKDEIKT